MDFSTYLNGKKIDAQKFEKGDPDLFHSWSGLFSRMHPQSFTSQKLYLINKIRRRYLLTETADQKITEKPKQPKPRILPKFKK